MADKIFLYYAPKILAGMGSVPFAAGAGFSKMSDAALVKNISLHRFGEDFALEGYLRDPYGAKGDISAARTSPSQEERA
jgi:diaminohydroxyphosphoribosylaminopyrimidine deaminase / 5-amino-6-(5-phosphoribosylamino)uracil reductase